MGRVNLSTIQHKKNPAQLSPNSILWQCTRFRKWILLKKLESLQRLFLKRLFLSFSSHFNCVSDILWRFRYKGDISVGWYMGLSAFISQRPTEDMGQRLIFLFIFLLSEFQVLLCCDCFPSHIQTDFCASSFGNVL